MSIEDRNPLQRWLDGSVEPERSEEERSSSFAEMMNRPGVETDPIFICEITFEEGQLTLSDHWCVWPEEGVTVSVKPGRYSVLGVGKAFGTERRIASVCLIHADHEIDQVEFKDTEAVGGDSWGLLIGEYKYWHDTLSDQEQEDLGEKQFGTYPDGCELFDLSVGEKSTQVIRSFTGFGSGLFPVTALWDGGECVGVVCDFIFEVEE